MGYVSIVVNNCKSILRVCVIDKTKILHEVIIDKVERALISSIKEQLRSEYNKKGFHVVSLSVLVNQ